MEGEEEVADDPSSNSSESEDLLTARIGGRLGDEFRRGAQPSEPPATGGGKVNFLSGHWLEFLRGPLGANSESSSGVAGVGESVEEVENEDA